MTETPAPAQTSTSAPRSRADLVLRIGFVVTALGLLSTLIACIPLIAPSVAMPSWMWGLSMLTGVGLLIVFAGFVAAGSGRRRTVRR